MKFWGDVSRRVRLLSLVLAIASGCQSPHRATPPSPTPDVRNNAASLLYDLLGEEKHVSKLLIIKRDRRELHEVIKNISATAGSAHEQIEKLAREDRTLNLNSKALPPGEQAARESESKARTKELLHASGPDFEFKLLLTQAESLAYMQHLALVAAQNETSPARAKVFADIAAQMSARHGEVLKLLREPRR